jgi:peptidyl-prolyl cis-trans isomerase D
VHSAQDVSRTPQAGATGPLANPKFLNALFSPDAVERKRNTEAVETGPNQLVSGRIVKYSAAHTRPFEEVKAQVRERVVAAKAAELARKDGEAKLAAWKAAPASATLPAAIALSRQDAGKQPRPVIDAALRADPARLPALLGVDLGADGYAIVQVNKVLPRDTPPPAQAQQEQQQYGRAWAAAETAAYYETLKDRFNVQIKVPKPRDAVPQ